MFLSTGLGERSLAPTAEQHDATPGGLMTDMANALGCCYDEGKKFFSTPPRLSGYKAALTAELWPMWSDQVVYQETLLWFQILRVGTIKAPEAAVSQNTAVARRLPPTTKVVE